MKRLDTIKASYVLSLKTSHLGIFKGKDKSWANEISTPTFKSKATQVKSKREAAQSGKRLHIQGGNVNKKQSAVNARHKKGNHKQLRLQQKDHAIARTLGNIKDIGSVEKLSCIIHRKSASNSHPCNQVSGSEKEELMHWGANQIHVWSRSGVSF